LRGVWLLSVTPVSGSCGLQLHARGIWCDRD